jgi:hypothetical protein
VKSVVLCRNVKTNVSIRLAKLNKYRGDGSKLKVRHEPFSFEDGRFMLYVIDEC